MNTIGLLLALRHVTLYTLHRNKYILLVNRLTSVIYSTSEIFVDLNKLDSDFLLEDKKIFLPVLRFEFVLADVSESVNELERFHSKNPVDIYILKHRIVGGWILTVFGSVSGRVQVVPCELFGSLTGGSPGVGWTLVTKSDAACSEFLAPDGIGCKQLAALLFYLRKVDCY